MRVVNVRLGRGGVWLEHLFRACHPGLGAQGAVLDGVLSK